MKTKEDIIEACRHIPLNQLPEVIKAIKEILSIVSLDEIKKITYK